MGLRDRTCEQVHADFCNLFTLIFVPGSWAFGPGRVCRFMRIFVSLASALHAAFGCGIRFNAVDAAFSKHTIYKDGFLHLLTTRDGNNRVLPLAWAVCETESADTYEWFSQQCFDAGLGRYLTKDSIVYSDRQKGIHHFSPSSTRTTRTASSISSTIVAAISKGPAQHSRTRRHGICAMQIRRGPSTIIWRLYDAQVRWQQFISKPKSTTTALTNTG